MSDRSADLSTKPPGSGLEAFDVGRREVRAARAKADSVVAERGETGSHFARGKERPKPAVQDDLLARCSLNRLDVGPRKERWPAEGANEAKPIRGHLEPAYGKEKPAAIERQKSDSAKLWLASNPGDESRR